MELGVEFSSFLQRSEASIIWKMGIQMRNLAFTLLSTEQLNSSLPDLTVNALSDKKKLTEFYEV